MYEVIRTRFNDDRPVVSDIIRYIESDEELKRFVTRFNRMFGEHGFNMICTYRHMDFPDIIYSYDSNGQHRTFTQFP